MKPLLVTLSLALCACIEPAGTDEPEPDTSATRAAVSTPELAATPLAEQIFWRCPSPASLHLTSEACAAVCATTCRLTVVCTDGLGRPVLCP